VGKTGQVNGIIIMNHQGMNEPKKVC